MFHRIQIIEPSEGRPATLAGDLGSRLGFRSWKPGEGTPSDQRVHRKGTEQVREGKPDKVGENPAQKVGRRVLVAFSRTLVLRQ